MKTNKPHNKTSQKNQRGFTLVETMIAALIMMVGALGVCSLFLYSTQNNMGGGDRALAMAVAQQQLERIRSVSFEDATLNIGTTTAAVRTGERNYTVQKVVANEMNTNGSPKQLKRITIRVTPNMGGPSWSRTPVEVVTLRSTLATGTFALSQ